MRETTKHPGLRQICFEDELIREFRLWLLEKLGSKNEQRRKDEDNVRTKMRALARLLLKLNEDQVFKENLRFYIAPKHFRAVVQAVKDLYREVNSPQLGLTLGHYIKQACLLKASLGLQTEDIKMKNEANDFMELYRAFWVSKVSSVADRSKRLNALNKRYELPCTDDLVRLKVYLEKEINEFLKNIDPTYAEYVAMTQVLIARIVLFNKRRISEVDELTVNDFSSRLKGEEQGTNTEIIRSLGITEQSLLKRTELIEVRGKSTRRLRKVFVILTADMVKGIEHTLMVRARAGVNPENKYLFGRTSSTPQDGCEAIREVTLKCDGLSNPSLIRTRQLRKYLATTTQVMEMSGDELQLVADHMGHSLAMHTDVYRLQNSVLERTKVARVLIGLENGNMGQFRGRDLVTVDLEDLPEPTFQDDDELEEEFESEHQSETMLDTECQLESYQEIGTEPRLQPDQDLHPKLSSRKGFKRKRWTMEEENDLRKEFKVHITEKRNPNTKEIKCAIEKYHSLKERSEAVIRSKINNIILGKIKM